MIGYHTPETKHELALNILSSILSSGKSSRLYASLVDEKQLATQVFTDYGDKNSPNLFNVYAVANKNVNEAEVPYTLRLKNKKRRISETNCKSKTKN
jgi:predicted Zn-dependent peptidase